MPVSIRRPRAPLFAAATFALTALTLTACSSEEGVRSEGAATPATQTVSKDAPAQKPSPSTGSASDGKGGNQDANASKGSGSRSKGGSSAASSDPNAPANRVRCTAANTKVTAVPVSRPLNHMLITVTNTGSKMCDLPGYPIVKFEGAQSVPPVMEESKPQAVTSIAPGEKGYAGVILSAGDGSAGEGYTARTLEVGFEGSDKMAKAALPAKGVYIDSSLRVTYWLTTAADALS